MFCQIHVTKAMKTFCDDCTCVHKEDNVVIADQTYIMTQEPGHNYEGSQDRLISSSHESVESDKT